jgi:hypothetical protein
MVFPFSGVAEAEGRLQEVNSAARQDDADVPEDASASPENN